MSTGLIVPTPAVRIVLADLVTVTRGPDTLKPDPAAANGLILLDVGQPSYSQEVFGPHLYADYSKVPDLIGFRTHIAFRLQLEQNSASGTFGMPLWGRYHEDSLTLGKFLQVNWFYPQAASVWRTFFPTTGFAPTPIGGKQLAGAPFQIDVQLESKYLTTTLGKFFDYTW